MDSADKQVLQILKTFTGLISNDAATPVLLGMLSGVVEACSNASDMVYEEIVTSMHAMAAVPCYRASMKKEGVAELLTSTIRPVLDEDGSDDYIQMIDQVLEWLDAGPSAASAAAGPSSSRASSKSHAPAAPVPEYTKRETHTIQINMDNLLGVRALEDQYIRALLMVDGVTSVTLDRKRELAIVYSQELAIKEALYTAVQATCDDIQDAAGKPRFVVRGDHALYLEEEEEPSLFEEAGTLARFGGDSWMDSAEDIARKRDAAQSAGWFSWLKW